MRRVSLEGAQDGRLQPVGRNPSAWAAEADALARTTLDAVDLAIRSIEPDDSGADIFGALAAAVRLSQQVPGEGTRAVFVVTGGGVHRTDRLDFGTIDFTDTDPLSIVQLLPAVDDLDVKIQIVGAGRFPNVQPTPSAEWSDWVRATYVAFCDHISVDSCQVVDLPSLGREDL